MKSNTISYRIGFLFPDRRHKSHLLLLQAGKSTNSFSRRENEKPEFTHANWGRESRPRMRHHICTTLCTHARCRPTLPVAGVCDEPVGPGRAEDVTKKSNRRGGQLQSNQKPKESNEQNKSRWLLLLLQKANAECQRDDELHNRRRRRHPPRSGAARCSTRGREAGGRGRRGPQSNALLVEW